MSSQALIVNSDNLISTATISVTSTKSASNTIRQKITNRSGTGRIELSGAFDGALDTTLDIKITSDNSTSPRVSNPIFIGGGSGELIDLSVDAGATSEKVTITLTDTGLKTKQAELDFYGVKLIANPIGSNGNTIYLEVDESDIVKSDTNYSTLDDISAGTESFDNPAYNFGAKPLNGDGTLNANTMRFVFGEDPTVYRMFSKYEDGKTIYYIDPPVVYDVPKATALKQVTGGYTLTIKQDATTETYENIITLYDALIKIKSGSSLVEVDGVVVDDRTPGGMSVDEFPLRTSSYALPATTSGSEYLTKLESISVEPDAPGQLIEIKCVDNAVVGAEKWKITAPSEGGELSLQATTGILYVADNFSFTIPKKIKDNPTDTGMKLEIKEIRLVSRGDDEDPIQICVDVPTCGINAEAKTITCVYTKAPDNKCDCIDMSYEGKLNEDCLGVTIEGGTNMALDAELATRLSTLYSWRKTFAKNNTALQASSGGTRSAFYDLELCDKITDIFAECLEETYDNATAMTEFDARLTEMMSDITALNTLQGAGSVAVATPGTTYTEGDYVVPPAHQWTGHKYQVIAASTLALIGSGATDSAKLGYVLPTEWPTDGSTTDTLRYDVFDSPEAYTYYLQFLDVGPLGDADIIYNNDANAVRSGITAFVRRYSAAMDYVRVLAGIIPKGDANTGGGNECWRKEDREYYWTVNGLEYLPAYTNVVYHSSKGKPDGSEVVCTKEFAFVIKVNESCEGGLKEGDTVVLEITGENVGNKTYSVDDVFNLPIIAGQPVYLAGGITGNDTLTWSVKGSTTGAMPALTMTGELSDDYDNNDLHFKIKQSAIPFNLNDSFSFSIESGTYSYRFGSSAWSADADIPATTTLLGNGVSATFISGSSPSFVLDDIYSYEIQQPFSYEAIKAPSYNSYSWNGSGTTLDIDFGSTKSVSCVSIGNHTLPSTATITLELYNASAVKVLTKSLTWTEAVILSCFDSISAKTAKIILANASSSSIGWVFLGTETSFTYDASNVRLNLIFDKSYNRGESGEISWEVGSGSFLTNDDYIKLKEKITYLKENYNQPCVFVPNKAFPEFSRLVSIDSDEISFSEYNNFCIRNQDERKISASIPFKAVYR